MPLSTLTKSVPGEYHGDVNVQPPPTRIRKCLAGWRLVLLFVLATALIYWAPVWLQSIKLTVHPISPPTPTSHAESFPDIPFLGVNIALEQYATATERSDALERLQEAGFGWVRQRLDWGELEPAPGQYNWTQSDALLPSIAAFLPIYATARIPQVAA